MRSARAKAAMALFALLVAIGVVGCGPSAKSEPTSSTQMFAPKRVVVTTPQLAEFTRIVGGSRVEVTQLVANSADPHAYELTPKDITAIAAADLVVVNGLGLDTWLTGRWDALEHHATLVDASVGIQPRRATALGTGAVDPHVWMDPVLAKLLVANIADALGRVDSEGEVMFGANSRAYQGQLQSLADSLRTTFAPYGGATIVVSHDALGYLADRVGVRIAGSVDRDFSRTLREPSEMGALVEAAKSARAVIVVDGVNVSTATQIAQDAGVRLLGTSGESGESNVSETSGSVPTQGARAVLADGMQGTYLETMTTNQMVLLSAMRPTP